MLVQSLGRVALQRHRPLDYIASLDSDRPPAMTPSPRLGAKAKAIYNHARFHKISRVQVAWQNSHRALRGA